jgi:hypothetical protein
MNRISDDPMLVALGNARARIHAATAGHGAGIFDLLSEIDTYRQGLKRCDMPHDVLLAAREELVDRMGDGWARATMPRLERFWIDLLVRYEVVCDALDVVAADRHLTKRETEVYLGEVRHA